MVLHTKITKKNFTNLKKYVPRCLNICKHTLLAYLLETQFSV